MTNEHPITLPPELVPQWQMDAWQARVETMGADVPAILLEIAQWGWAQREPELAMHFRGVPLVPPLDCADPQSWIAEQIYQMGADHELEACCLLMDDWGLEASDLRAARHPKPPSLKEQALEQLNGIATLFQISFGGDLVCDTIRRALEALPDD